MFWDADGCSTSMSGRFLYPNFEGDISRWDVSSVASMASMFVGGNLTTDSCDRILVSRAAPRTQPEASGSVGPTHDSRGGPAEARVGLVPRGWAITDGGMVP